MTTGIAQSGDLALQAGMPRISVRKARRRRRVVLNLARLALVVVALGSWELLVRSGHIDPFFWGQPSGVWDTLRTWVTEGTPQGSLAEQILVTLQEAVYGFVIGVVLGVVSGIALGRERLPRRPAVPVHQGRELHPPHRAGVALRRSLSVSA